MRKFVFGLCSVLIIAAAFEHRASAQLFPASDGPCNDDGCANMTTFDCDPDPDYPYPVSCSCDPLPDGTGWFCRGTLIL
jgi:hypothetical protein